MQKAFKILGVFALAVAIGLSMAACTHDASSEGSQKFIKITSIPSAYNGKYGSLMLSQSNSSYYTVYSMETMTIEEETTEDGKIINSFSFPMLNWKNDSRPWGGSGSYKITIFIYNSFDAMVNDEKSYIYAGVIPENIDISEITTEIAWSSFTQKTGLNLNFQFKK